MNDHERRVTDLAQPAYFVMRQFFSHIRVIRDHGPSELESRIG